MIYFAVLILMLVCVYAYDYRGYKRFFYLTFWGFFVALVFIAGLRYRIGTDSIQYERVYDSVPTLWELPTFNFDSTRFEPGFMIFESIPRSLGNDFTYMQFFQAMVVNLVIFWFILKNATHKYLCLLLYYIVLYLNLNTQVMREALAVAAFLLAWPYFRDGKWIKYYILAIIATFLHSSAIITLLLPLFCLPALQKGFIPGWKTVYIGIIVFVIGYFIQSHFKDVFMLIAVNDRITDRVDTYAKEDIGSGVMNIMGMLDWGIRTVLYPAIAVWLLRNKRKKEKNITQSFQRLEIIVMSGVYILILAMPVFIMTRFLNYFGMFDFLVIANVAFSKITLKRKIYKLRLGYWIILLLPYFFFQFKAYNHSLNKDGTLKWYMIYYPYVSRLDPYQDNSREEVYRYLDAR